MTRKRITVIAIAVLVAAIVPTLAHAKPTPATHYELGPNGEIPAIVQSKQAPAESDDERSIELNAYTVSGFALSLSGAVVFGMGIAYWRRRTRPPQAWCR